MATSEAAESLLFQAIQRARYNEAVHIEVTGDHGVREISLAACLDEKNGGIVWNPLESDGGHDECELKIQRHLRTKRWVFPMLNDHRRNLLYQQAIIKAVDQVMRNRMQQKSADGREDDDGASKTIYVLDIGTGSGLLSMMSAKAIISKKQQCATSQSDSEPTVCVYSVEMSSAMAHLAHQIIRDNEMDPYIRVLSTHSSKLKIQSSKKEEGEESLVSRVDLCVSELLESGLLGEGLLPSLRLAWRNVLKPDAIVVPQLARVFAVVVEDADDGWVSRLHPSALFRQETQLGMRWNNVFDGSVTDATGVAFSLHAEKLLRDGNIRMLTEPACILSIGLNKDLIPDEKGQEQVAVASVTNAGTANAILVWWELDLWKSQRRDEEPLTYSMDPRDSTAPFQDHWHHCLHVLPSALHFSSGDMASIHACHDDASIQVQLLSSAKMASDSAQSDLGNRADNTVGKASKRPRYDPLPLGPHQLSPFRTLQLTDTARLQFFRAAIQDASCSFAKRSKTGNDRLHVLDLSDFGWCGILAAIQGCARVTSLECSPGNIHPIMTSKVAQASRLPEGCSFEILACQAEDLNQEILGGVPSIVISEPYYYALEGWHLQEALNYYFTIRSLRRESVLSSDTVVIPSACRIMACGIESQQLRSCYSPCGDDQSSSVCGFDHRALNRCCFISETTLTLPLWQYDYKRLTDEIEIGYLDYESPQDDCIRLSSKASVIEIGHLDALVIWLDYLYNMRREELAGHVLNLPTDSRSFLQGVRMLKTQVDLNTTDVLRTEVQVDLALGDLNGSDDHAIVVNLIHEDSA